MKRVLLITAALLLTSCDKQEEVIELPLRSVKSQQISYSSDKLIKTFSGVTKAELEASLSFRVSGRVEDIPVKVDGSAVFGIDVTIPGQKMSYAAVKAPPVVGAKVASMDASAGVMRCGRTAGSLVPMRRSSTCGISRRAVSS